MRDAGSHVPAAGSLEPRATWGAKLSGRRWRFYVTPAGGKVVRKELEEVGPEAGARVADAMKRFQRGEHFPYEYERISADLEAIRVFIDHATYRVLFATEGRNTMVFLALHVFQKTDRKLPKRNRKLAERRLRDWRERGNT